MTTTTYLTLDELEDLAFQFPGFEILAAQGPAGDEWHLRVPMNGTEVTMRAHRVAMSA